MVDVDRTTINCFKHPHDVLRQTILGTFHLHQAHSNAVSTRLTNDQTREVEVRSISLSAGAVCTSSTFGKWMCGVGNLPTKLVVKNFIEVIDECRNSPDL